MTVDELIKYVTNKIDDINEKFPNSISNEEKENYIKDNITIDMTPNEIDKQKVAIDNIVEEFIKKLEERQEYLKQLSKKFNDGYYQPQNIDDVDISTLNYDQMEDLFFH